MSKNQQGFQKPMDILRRSINSNILVDVRGNRQYSGILDGYDIYMNLVIRNAMETINGESQGTHSIMLVRGDNVVFVSPSEEDSA